MRCPLCDSTRKSQVIDSRPSDGGRSIRRRRVCAACNGRFTTYEYVETPKQLIVVKRDDSRAPYDRKKVITGLEKACYKRPVSAEQIVELAEDMEEELFKQYDREVEAIAIAEAVAERLRLLDQVAYVRYASVYKQFRDLDDLIDEVRHMKQNTDDPDGPGQGRLF